jgi:hypothetical protein
MGGAESFPVLLDALHAEVAPGRFVSAPSGHVLASSATLGMAGPESLLRFGLACVTATAVRDEVQSVCDEATAGRFAEGLHGLQLLVLSQALRYTVARLGQRVSEGTSLLARPQIQADLADVAMVIQEAAIGSAEIGFTTRWARHVLLVDAGRLLLRLLGGHSMLVDSPATDLYLTEVAGNVYLQPQTGDYDD